MKAERTAKQKPRRKWLNGCKVVWTEPTLQQLDAIAEYIAFDHPLAAKNLIKAVFDKTERLTDIPKPERTPPELPDPVYREIVVPPCQIFYREDGHQAWIVYVMRAKQKLRAFMLNLG